MSFYLFKKLDWFLIAAVLILITFGLISLYSTSPRFFWRQLLWAVIFILVLFLGAMFDWSWLINQSWFRQGFYWLSVILLLAVSLKGQLIRGTRSWIVLGDFQFEPSELAKISVILMLASFFSRRYIAAWVGRNILISFLYVIIPTVLIALQPDFGSAIVFVALWLGFIFMSGIDKKKFIFGVILFIILAIFIWHFYLKPYQKERLIGFLFPEFDPLGVNYSVIQSKIAIGSAGWWGKGFGRGTQSQLGFLPEVHSDFIFAALTEEGGIMAGLLVVLIFLFIIYRLVNIGIAARDNYSKFIVLGTIFTLVIHFSLNLGANLGLLPVTGITFPFLSYGGSNLLTLGILMGIIQHIKLESS